LSKYTKFLQNKIDGNDSLQYSGVLTIHSTMSGLGCEFLVTVFLYYILIHQSQAGSVVSF